MKKFLSILIFVIALPLTGAFAQQPMILPIDTQKLSIMTARGKADYDVEVAFSFEQARQGLMFRTYFPQNRAMLFKFVNESMTQMWMANTPLPLDILFLNREGTIVSIAENTVPFSTDIVQAEGSAAFAVELNHGQVREKRLEKGQRVIHPAICGSCQ